MGLSTGLGYKLRLPLPVLLQGIRELQAVQLAGKTRLLVGQ